jgi:hypothetical protein
MNRDISPINFFPEPMQKVIEDEELPQFQYAYRYEDGTDCIHLAKLRILRDTPKGFVVQDYGGKEVFCLSNDKQKGRRYAYLDKADALDSYIRRKQGQIEFGERQIRLAKEYLELAQKVQIK